MEVRVGQGIDVHPFADNRKLILGGVTIPSAKGLQGHSDADVLTHSIMDAILGAAGKQDIGFYFPNTDSKWKDADSIRLLAEVVGIISADGWRIVNIDSTLLAEVPKISPYILAMKERLSGALQITLDCIGIKATTTERLGFVGREEGIVASTVVLLRKE